MGKAGLIVAGTRHCKDREIVEYLIQLVIDDTLTRFGDCAVECIIEGGARGVDTYAKEYAHNIRVEVAEFEADWHPNGSSYCDKSAGYKRNVRMHQYLKNFDVRVCLCIWDGESRGTAQNFKLSKDNDELLWVYDYVHKRFISNWNELLAY